MQHICITYVHDCIHMLSLCTYESLCVTSWQPSVVVTLFDAQQRTASQASFQQQPYLLRTRGLAPALYDPANLRSATFAGSSRRAPIVTSEFLTTVVRPHYVVPGAKPSVHIIKLSELAQTTVVVCSATPPLVGTRPKVARKLAAVQQAVERVRVPLADMLVQMQETGVAAEPDDYGGPYIKVGMACQQGRHKPQSADVWVLPCHDTHMDLLAHVYVLMLPLQQCAATVLRMAGEQAGRSEASLLKRTVARFGLDVSKFHCPPAFAVRGVLGLQPLGAHTDPDQDQQQVVLRATPHTKHRLPARTPPRDLRPEPSLLRK